MAKLAEKKSSVCSILVRDRILLDQVRVVVVKTEKRSDSYCAVQNTDLYSICVKKHRPSNYLPY